MKLLRQLLYAFTSAWQNFWRNLAVSVAAVVSIALILVLAGTSLLLGHALGQVLESYQRRVSVLTISIADGTPLAAIYDFAGQLQARPDVVRVSFISKDEELRSFASDARNQQLIEQIEGNPLPAKLEVTVARLDDIQRIDALAPQWRRAERKQPT